MRRNTRCTGAAAALAALTLVAGCGSPTDSASGADNTAVAAFYPLSWATEQVAGSDWEVVNLTSTGTEPHDLTLDIAQTARIEAADLIVLETGFQPAVDRTVEENGGDAAVIDAAKVIELRAADDHDHTDEHSPEHGDEQGHDEAGHDEEGHEESDQDEAEHDHGDLDLHFWLDPLKMADLGDAVADQLSELDSEHADDYAARAADLRGDLEALDQEYVEGLASCARDVSVVSHAAFGYLERYGVHFESIAGLSPDAEATPADLARLQELITSEGLTTVFSERLSSAKMSQTLADDLGISTAVLDPIEGLADETADEDYLSLMRANLEALKKANGCE